MHDQMITKYKVRIMDLIGMLSLLLPLDVSTLLGHDTPVHALHQSVTQEARDNNPSKD